MLEDLTGGPWYHLIIGLAKVTADDAIVFCSLDYFQYKIIKLKAVMK